MKLSLQQNVRTELGLRLSPQILQRIEVLQLAALDLLGLVEQELQENEALEVASDGDAEGDAAGEDGAEGEGDEDLALLADEDADDWSPPDRERKSAGEVLEATAEARISLTEHLERQLELLELSPREQALARAIVQAIGPRGWLDQALEEVESDLEPPPGMEEREHALRIVQRLEPAGVGCRDLVECLLLQLDARGPDYAFLAQLILDHLDDIARNRVPRIARATGRSVEEVLRGMDAVAHLDPFPGRGFAAESAPVLRPDVLVQRAGDDYEISLDNEWLPDLTVSRSVLAAARDRRVDPELRRHMRGKIEAARSLIDAVAQRKHTLFRVASEIVQRQPEFLEHGRSRLRPMRMQDVADALGVHVSTISRSVAGKSMQTPRGIVSMKDLFTGEVPARAGPSEPGAGRGPALQHADGEGESRAAVQELVRALVAAEDRRHPLSDEAIVAALAAQHGLDIARRTVTKYRKALGIGSSRARRSWTA